MPAPRKPRRNEASAQDSTPPQRSSRAPAEGADLRPDAEPEYDHTQADGDHTPLERSSREPAEGRRDDTPGRRTR